MAKRSSTDVTVTARFTFEGQHYWSDAPDAVKFLRNPHRHIFHVEGVAGVTHDDRDVEFIMFGHQLKNWIHATFSPARYDSNILDLGFSSCEQIARLLLERFGLVSCSVFEDGENGATVYSHPVFYWEPENES
jgi:hypothetical protein